jgi:hypothetical protein
MKRIVVALAVGTISLFSLVGSVVSHAQPVSAAARHTADEFRSPTSAAALKNSLTDIGYPQWWPVPEQVSADTVVAFLRGASLSIGTPAQLSESYSTSFFEPSGDAQTVLDRIRKTIPLASLGVEKPEILSEPKNDLATLTITETYRNADRNTVLILSAEQIDSEGPPAKKGVLHSISFFGPLGSGTMFPSEADWAWRSQLPVLPKGSVLAETSMQLRRFDDQREVKAEIRFDKVNTIPALIKTLSKKTKWTRGATFVSSRKGFFKDTYLNFLLDGRAGSMNLDASVRMVTVSLVLP